MMTPVVLDAKNRKSNRPGTELAFSTKSNHKSRTVGIHHAAAFSGTPSRWKTGPREDREWTSMFINLHPQRNHPNAIIQTRHRRLRCRSQAANWIATGRGARNRLKLLADFKPESIMPISRIFILGPGRVGLET